MKNIIIVNTNAQIENKKFYLDGNLVFGKENIAPYNQYSSYGTLRSFGISPNFGFLLNKNFILGGGIGYEQGKAESVIFDPYSTGIGMRETAYRVIEPAIFLKYIHQFNNNLIVGLKMNLAYRTEGIDVSESALPSFSNFNVTNTYLNASLSPEMQFMITNSWGLQLNVDVFNVSKNMQSNFTRENNNTNYTFNLNPSNLTMGVFVYFGDSGLSKN